MDDVVLSAVLPSLTAHLQQLHAHLMRTADTVSIPLPPPQYHQQQQQQQVRHGQRCMGAFQPEYQEPHAFSTSTGMGLEGGEPELVPYAFFEGSPTPGGLLDVALEDEGALMEDEQLLGVGLEDGDFVFDDYTHDPMHDNTNSLKGRQVADAQPPVSQAELAGQTARLARLLSGALAAAAAAASHECSPPSAQALSAQLSESVAVSGTARLRTLAAYEWVHEHSLLQVLGLPGPLPDSSVQQYLSTTPYDSLEPSARVRPMAGRLALLSALQAACDALPAHETALNRWDAASHALALQVRMEGLCVHCASLHCWC